MNFNQTKLSPLKLRIDALQQLISLNEYKNIRENIKNVLGDISQFLQI